jgi:hypothetical protein
MRRADVGHRHGRDVRLGCGDPAGRCSAAERDGIAGFNHPGREVGRFGSFVFDERLRDRMVSMEIFNRGEDYLFEGIDAGSISPLTACLDRGWRVGLLGVTDEHGTDWGYPDGKGRTGLYVKQLTRAGVREAMEARRFFSTRLRGFRVGATANGVPMGSTLAHRKGVVRFAVDVSRGAGLGRPPAVGAGADDRHSAADGRARAALRHAARGPAASASTCPIDVEDGRWVCAAGDRPAGEPRRPAPRPTAGSATAWPTPRRSTSTRGRRGAGRAAAAAAGRLGAARADRAAAAAAPRSERPGARRDGGAGRPPAPRR